MRKKSLVVAIVFLMTGFWMNCAFAGEMDILVEKLVKKGVISPTDANEILIEVKEEAKKEREVVVQETKASLKEDGSLALNLPDWVKKIKLNGDFRLRYQNTDKDGSPDRDRGRYRLRVGLESKITDKVTAGFGLATGSDDPRSTNQTMQNSFETGDIRLDYAYASYKPCSWLTLTGGKIKNPIWSPSDLLWDSDIRPEGLSVLLTNKMENAELFVNTGAWILDDVKSESDDPIMFVVQPGIKINFGDSAYFKNALAYYNFTNVKGANLDHSEGNNARDDDDFLENDYDAFALSSELGLNTSNDIIPFVALFGEYVNNTTESSDDTGYLVGIKFGDKKVEKAKQWQAKALYRRLEQEAWLDIFPDSDAYGGKTGAKGYELIFNYGLTKNISLAFDYYSMKNIDGPSVDEDVFQADLNFKF